MKKRQNIRSIVFSVMMAAMFLVSCSDSKTVALTDLNDAVLNAKPGDTITVANGAYNDVTLKLSSQGTSDQPIVIQAETKGEVIIGGHSTLAIGGAYLVIDGLFFKDGILGKQPVITFKEGGDVAKNCRLTNCAIENFNPESRFTKTDWVNLYGQHNQIDHCTFTNKYNAGLMLAVKLSNKESQNNHHKIEYNHFKNRPRLGSNGGETVRIGTSTYSLEPAHVAFTNNYFEHCGGEVEILSVKSTDNLIQGNVFYECEGVLALRHGNNNTVVHNSFIGNNKPNTGGIRVINAGHTIKYNHFQELTGSRFWSALAVMNGVPNSAINRYHQVKDVHMSDNTFINCDHIGFGIGVDGERTAVPQNVGFYNNTIYSDVQQTIQFLDDMSGIRFKENTINAQVKTAESGFNVFPLVVEDGELMRIASAPEVLSVSKEACGANWFSKETPVSKTKNLVAVNNAEELENAVLNASAGDVIQLTSGVDYCIEEPLSVKTKLSLVCEKSDDSPVIKFQKNISKPILTICEGADLTLEGINFEGLTDGGIAPCALKTQDQAFLTQYNLHVKNCHFYNFNAGGRTAFSATPTSYADSIVFESCKFSNISGIAINLKAEKDDVGRYNAENVIINNCLFYDVMGSAIDLYRGGNDESTSGPKMHISSCTFYNVENRELGSVINLTGVQEMSIQNCVFSESGKSGRVINMESPRWADCDINNCNFYNTGRIETFYNNRLGNNIWYKNPMFTSVEQNDYTLSKRSSLLKMIQNNEILGYNE